MWLRPELSQLCVPRHLPPRAQVLSISAIRCISLSCASLSANLSSSSSSLSGSRDSDPDPDPDAYSTCTVRVRPVTGMIAPIDSFTTAPLSVLTPGEGVGLATSRAAAEMVPRSEAAALHS